MHLGAELAALRGRTAHFESHDVLPQYPVPPAGAQSTRRLSGRILSRVSQPVEVCFRQKHVIVLRIGWPGRRCPDLAFHVVVRVLVSPGELVDDRLLPGHRLGEMSRLLVWVSDIKA